MRSTVRNSIVRLFTGSRTYRVEYLIEVVIVCVAHISAYNFIASLALEAILYIMSTEAPNRFASDNAKEYIIVSANICRAAATASKVARAAIEGRTSSTRSTPVATGCLTTSVAR